MLKYDIQLRAKYDRVMKKMHDKKMITYGAETVGSYLNKLEAKKLDETIRHNKATEGIQRSKPSPAAKPKAKK